jgi:hypothetical protein
MTYEEGIQWLLARGGSVTSTNVANGAEVIASAHGVSSRSVIAERPSDRSEVRRCELEAITQLKRILEA